MGQINTKKIAILLILMVLAIYVVFRFLGRETTGISYRTAQVDRNDIISKITATGTINPINIIDVRALMPGVISRLYVDFNSEVTKDEPLAEIDPSLFENKLKLAEVEYKKAQSSFNIANSLYMTDKELSRNMLISKEKFDVTHANYSAALAAYNQSKAALEIAQSNMKNTIIRSPIDGVVLARNVNVGQAITPNGQPLFILADSLTKMKLDVNVSEVHIGKVEKGQKVYFTVAAYPNEVFNGTVSQVINNPTITNSIVSYNVVVLIDNDKFLLKPGMTALADIILADEKDVLRVPTAALRFIPLPSSNIKTEPDDASGGSHVWILLKDGKITPVSVRPGVSDDMYTEINEGDIKEGQKVIVESSVSESESRISNTYLPQPGRF
jgi:HlyD family secretion protein